MFVNQLVEIRAEGASGLEQGLIVRFRSNWNADGFVPSCKNVHDGLGSGQHEL